MSENSHMTYLAHSDIRLDHLLPGQFQPSLPRQPAVCHPQNGPNEVLLTLTYPLTKLPEPLFPHHSINQL